MSRLPIVEKRRRKTIRKRLARRFEREAMADYARYPFPAGVPEKEIVTVSKTAAQKADREESRIRTRDEKKAEHKLAFFDRIFGLGRGPAGLRMKWLDRLLGNEATK